MKNILIRLKTEDDGGHLIEYSLVAGVIALGAVAALTTLKTQIVASFNKVTLALYSSF